MKNTIDKALRTLDDKYYVEFIIRDKSSEYQRYETVEAANGKEAKEKILRSHNVKKITYIEREK